MSAMSIVHKGSRSGLALCAALAFLPPLVTRLVMGQAFFLTGRGKIQNIDKIGQFFASLNIPLPEVNAAFISHLEYYGGMLLIIGLLTRLVAALLSCTMVVALMTADKQDFLGALHMTSDKGLTDVVPFVYLLFLAWLVIKGPGAVSVDALLKRWLFRGERPPAGA
jgi:putative oxidoreductase